jgi:hypothetical protein
MTRHRLMPGLAILLLAACALIVPGERSGPAQSGSPLFFAMSIADETGALLAEPRLLGQDGMPLEMTLAEPGAEAEPRMSLWMQPEMERDGSYEICFEISLPGRVEKGKGRVRLRSGEEKSTRVAYPGGHLDVQLAAFDVRSPEFHLYMQYGQALRGPGRT